MSRRWLRTLLDTLAAGDLLLGEPITRAISCSVPCVSGASRRFLHNKFRGNDDEAMEIVVL